MDDGEIFSLAHSILKNANVGLWVIEIDESLPKRMYIDENMYIVFGIDKNLSPEETFTTWLNSISKNDKETVLSTINQMIGGKRVDIHFTWIHPNNGEINIHFGGERNYSYTNGIRIEGYQQQDFEFQKYKQKLEKAEKEIKIEKDDKLRVISQEQENVKKIMELSEDFESIYDVDVITGNYSVYTKTGNYTEELIDNLGLSDNYYKSNEINIPLAIYPDDQPLLLSHLNQNYFLHELPKIKRVELDYRCLIKGKPIWYRMRIVKIGDWKKEKHAIVGLINNEENHKREQRLLTYQQDEDFYKQAILSSAYSYYKINLTQNKVISPIIENNKGQPEDFALKFGEHLPDYDTIVKICAKRYVNKDYKKTFILSLSSQNLINQFLCGNTMPEYRCYIKSTVLGWHYRKYVNYLSQDKINGDILCMTVAYDITEEIRQEEEEKERLEIINVLTKDYTAIYYADLKENKMTPYILNDQVVDNVRTQLKISQNLEVMLNWFTENYIHKEDQQNFLKSFDEIYKTRKFKKNFSVFFRRNYHGEYLYSELQCVRIDKGTKPTDTFIMAFAEKDSAFKKEAENQKKLKQDFEIINTLASEYSTVFYVDFNENKIIPYNTSLHFQKIFDSLHFNHMNINIAFNIYVNTFVYEPDKKRVLSQGDINVIKEKLKDKKSCELIFRVKTKKGPEYRQMRYVKVDAAEQEPTAVAIALADRNDEIINQFINTQIINEFLAVYYLDLETETARSIKVSNTVQFLQSNTSNFKRLISTFLPFVANDYQEDWKKFCDVNYLKNFVKNEDTGEFTYQLNINNNEWQRCEWQVIERKNNLPSVILVYFRKLDVNTAQTLELTEKIAAQNLELESKQKQLESALSLAQSANRAKTTFLNSMSHDIRTPMNAIIGFTGLASTHVDKPELVRNYLTKINQSSQHLLSLINDVLDMSRIESGKMVISEHPENLAEILHSLRDLILTEVNSKNQELIINTIDVTNENILCDRLRLNQVLINIISNAIKYTNKGGKITVSIIQKNTKNDKAEYEFRIKDNGIGMSPEFIKTIFEPFTREKTATISGIQGTGLGMSITKNIIDMMGGKIEVNSEPGVGSEFILTLKFRLTDQNTNIIKIQKFENSKCLVVDDNLNTCQSITKMLHDFGIVNECCSSIKEAVQICKNSKQNDSEIKVIIVKWNLDGSDGIENAKKLRQYMTDEQKIVMVTSNDLSDKEDEAKACGVNYFISNPIFPSDLQAVLLKCTDQAVNFENTSMFNSITGKHILLVEDNLFNQEIATEILTETGIIVDVAENGEIAVNKIAKSKVGTYDAVLMDIQMPVMDGLEATRQIRKLRNTKLATIPVIAMTANAFEEDKEKAFEAGMNGHLAKPIDVNKLLSILELVTKK